jgi:hypothetical protein
MTLKGRIEKLEAALGAVPTPGDTPWGEVEISRARESIAALDERVQRGRASPDDREIAEQIRRLARRVRERLHREGATL